jgi:PKD repeat protein/subtilisin family serine protease
MQRVPLRTLIAIFSVLVLIFPTTSKVYPLPQKTTNAYNVLAPSPTKPELAMSPREDLLTPTDPLYPLQWSLDKIAAPLAWDVTTGSATVVIAIIDTGIDLGHPDLANRLWTNPGEAPGNGIDDDQNGRIDDSHGWNFADNNNTLTDSDGHGTMLAGLAAAQTNNGIGIAGMCWNCRVMPVKVTQTNNLATPSKIAQGIRYAASKGAEVILIGQGTGIDSPILEQAINEIAENILVIAPAGDGNSNLKYFPAAYSKVLSVAGTNETDDPAGFTNYGDWVDLAAPATNLHTTQLGGGFAPGSGTSMAAAIVAGLGGLARSQNPGWTANLLSEQLIHTTDAIASTHIGSGRINAQLAVITAPHPKFSIVSTLVNGHPLGRLDPGQSASLEIKLYNEWLDATQVTVSLVSSDPNVTITSGSAGFGDILVGKSAFSDPAFSISVAPGAGFNLPIPFQLHLTANGDGYSDTLEFTLMTRAVEQNVSGTIAANTTWTNDKTYVVTNNVGVAPGATLTIQAGTVIRFNGNYNLNVGGQLIADGAPTQPIWFTSNTTGTWGRILFDDPSIDATASSAGEYLSGNLLRWAWIDKAAQGVGCSAATPYVAYITVNGGGLDCSLGSTPAWIQDSTISGNINIIGNAQIWRSDVQNGGVTVTGQTIVADNTIFNNLSAGSNSTIIDNIITYGNLTAGNGSTVVDNQLLAGALSANGSSTVRQNQVSGGGIVVTNGSLVEENYVRYAVGWAISATGNTTIQHNRVISNTQGINAADGVIQANLISNVGRTGLQINGNASVTQNTLISSTGNAVVVNSGSPVIQANNLEFNRGTYDLVNNTANALNASGNWWGTTDENLIGARIFDFQDDYNKGVVTFTPLLTAPDVSAPGYVRSVSLAPGSPTGIGSTVFDIAFSKPMDDAQNPAVVFHQAKKGGWEWFTYLNSGLPGLGSCGPAFTDSRGTIWIGSGRYWYDENATLGDFCSSFDVVARHSDGRWEVQNFGHTMNGLGEDLAGNMIFPPVYVSSVAVNPKNGDIWMGKFGYRLEDSGLEVIHSDGSHQVYSAPPLVQNWVFSLAFDEASQELWIATYGGISVLNSRGEWKMHLIGESVVSIDIDKSGKIWAGTHRNGVWVYDRSERHWSHYTPSDFGLYKFSPSQIQGRVWWVDADVNGNVWFSPGRFWESEIPYTNFVGVVHPDGSWERFGVNTAWSSASDQFGTTIFGTQRTGWAVHWGGTDFDVSNEAAWLSQNSYQAAGDVSAQASKGQYAVQVQGAFGQDGIEIAPSSIFTFDIDYPGEPDTTQLPAPAVTSCSSGELTTLSASWSSEGTTPDLYRYAIGTAPGQNDVVEWVPTSATSILRNNLNLMAGETYYFSVRARGANGVWSEAGTSNGVIAGSGPCPQADFSVNPTGGPAPLQVQFTNLSSGVISSYAWNFGDGGTSSQPNPAHTYAAPGVYDVTLTVSGLSGTGTETKTAYIQAYSPSQADFSSTPTSGLAPLEVQFTDQSSGVISSYAWNFGDGGTSSQQNPTHTFSAPGVYDVTLAVNGPSGSSTETKTAYIQVYGPSDADFNANPTSGPVPLEVQFTDQSSGEIASYAWNFGDGGTSSQKNPLHTFTASGVYDVTLSVNGPSGASTETKMAYIQVYDSVQANFSASPTRGLPNMVVNFTNLSSGDYDTCSWDFGDGTSSNECQIVAHTYIQPGVYTVSLTVEGPGGAAIKIRPSYISISWTTYLPFIIK